MVYLDCFTFPNNDKEFAFFMSIKRTCYDSFYPFKVLSVRGLGKIDFDTITILYGGNGSGKSTVLNVIAEKADIKRDSILQVMMCSTTYLIFEALTRVSTEKEKSFLMNISIQSILLSN